MHEGTTLNATGEVIPGVPSRSVAWPPGDLEALPVAAYACDAEGLLLGYNRLATQTWGREPRLNDSADRFCGSLRLLTADGAPLPHDASAMALALHGGREPIDQEMVIERPDGGRARVRFHVTLHRDQSGRVVGALGVLTDGVAKADPQAAKDDLADRALKMLGEQRARHGASANRLRAPGERLWTSQELKPFLMETLRITAAIEGTDLGVVTVWDRDRHHAVLGASLGVEGEWLALIERVPIGAGGCGRCWAEGRRIVIEDIETDPAFELHRGLARNAGIRAAHCTPMMTRAGDIVGVVTTYFRETWRPSERVMDLVDLCAGQAVDLIENGQLRARLREADERRNQFLAVLAHELRNPLAPIRNALELIRTDSSDPTAFERTHALMERQVHQMVRLIDDLMDASRLTHGQFVLKKEQTTLSAVLESAFEICRPGIETAGHHFTTSLPEEPVALEADATRLAQVFANLLDNASKFTHPGGHIGVDVRRIAPDRVQVLVRDDGVGMAANSLPRIFEMFNQVGSALDRSESGLGVGLSLARGLVDLHGGTLTAHSEGIGLGSVFVVELPTTGTTAGTRDGPERGRARDLQAAPTRILIVDDNVDAATSFSELVGRMGHETRITHDGIDAVRLAAEFRPEIVFLDIGLPRLNGYEVAKAIRSQWWGRAMFLVALTGWGQEKDKRKALESGIDLHLVKPLNPASVGDLIRRCRRS